MNAAVEPMNYNPNNTNTNNANSSINQNITFQPTFVVPQTVVAEQPRFLYGRMWSSGICACCDDLESCCCVAFCPHCYICHMYMQYNENCCAPGLLHCDPLLLRVQHRNRHKIQGSILDDCLTSWCCYLCSICQLKRDMNHVMNLKGSLQF